jgi:hypothetical protein
MAGNPLLERPPFGGGIFLWWRHASTLEAIIGKRPILEPDESQKSGGRWRL